MDTMTEVFKSDHTDNTKAQVTGLPSDVSSPGPKSESQVIALVDRKKNRAIRAILGTKERDIDPYIDDETAVRFRKVVLDELNDLVEFVKDVLASSPEGQSMVVNDLYLQKIDDLHRHLLGE